MKYLTLKLNIALDLFIVIVFFTMFKLYHDLRYMSISRFEIAYNMFEVNNMRLKDLREDSDITQKQLADYLNIKQNTYSQYENGQRQIPIDTLIKLACYFNTSVDYMLGLTDERKPYPMKK